MRILCVGTGPRAEYLVGALTESNHSVSTIDSVGDGAYLVAVEHIDAVIALTHGNAVEAAHAMQARPEHTVLVLIDNPGNEASRIAALYAGADVCFSAQYEHAELEARLHALWRDAGLSGVEAKRSDASSGCSVSLSRGTRSLTNADGSTLALSRREYLLMERLLRSVGRIVPRDELIAYVFGDSDADGVSLQRVVAGLRRRMDESVFGVRLDTVPRVGYCLVVGVGE